VPVAGKGIELTICAELLAWFKKHGHGKFAPEVAEKIWILSDHQERTMFEAPVPVPKQAISFRSPPEVSMLHDRLLASAAGWRILYPRRLKRPGLERPFGEDLNPLEMREAVSFWPPLLVCTSHSSVHVERSSSGMMSCQCLFQA